MFDANKNQYLKSYEWDTGLSSWVCDCHRWASTKGSDFNYSWVAWERQSSSFILIYWYRRVLRHRQRSLTLTEMKQHRESNRILRNTTIMLSYRCPTIISSSSLQTERSKNGRTSWSISGWWSTNVSSDSKSSSFHKLHIFYNVFPLNLRYIYYINII